MRSSAIAHRFATMAVALTAGLHFAGVAQDAPKNPPRRLPPVGSQTSAIPGGVDTGSPSTSSAMPLGTPVPPALSADRGDQNKRSAAARAAARPAPAASSASGVSGNAPLYPTGLAAKAGAASLPGSPASPVAGKKKTP